MLCCTDGVYVGSTTVFASTPIGALAKRNVASGFRLLIMYDTPPSLPRSIVEIGRNPAAVLLRRGYVVRMRVVHDEVDICVVVFLLSARHEHSNWPYVELLSIIGDPR